MSNHYAFIFKSMNKTVVNFLSTGCITHLEIGVAGRGILGMEAIEKENCNVQIWTSSATLKYSITYTTIKYKSIFILPPRKNCFLKTFYFEITLGL